MKKIVVLLFAIITLPALAQYKQQDDTKVISTSKDIKIYVTKDTIPPKPPMRQCWDLRFGGGVMYKMDSKSALDLSLRYIRMFKESRTSAYWGAQIGFGTTVGSKKYQSNYGDDYIDSNYYAGAIYIGPQIGYQKEINSKALFDISLVVNYQCIIGLMNPHQVLFQLQPGFWFKKFFVGVNGQVSTNSTTSFGLDLGYRF